MVKNSPAPLLRRLLQHSRAVALGTLIAFTPIAMVGCYGQFPLTHAVYEFNGDVSENDVVDSVLFWVFVILPVYGLAMLGDAVIFNLIEFWTDETIEVGSTTTTTTPDGYTVTVAPSQVEGEKIMTLTKDGKILSEQRIVKVSETEFAVYDGGTVAGKVFKTDKGLQLTNAQGKIVRTLAPESI